MVWLATKTLELINHTIEQDQGASYRVMLGKVLPHMKDAYRGEDEGFRSHLGASLIGKACARQIWYGFRWFKKAFFPARILRLFNRGHLEEARFIAMLLAAGIKVYQQDAAGNQFRISECGGHFGGSGDGVAVGIPDLDYTEPVLTEYKTHGSKSFKKLVANGVKSAKPEHYTQMIKYCHRMGLRYALYGAVNKDDDDLYFEIIEANTPHSNIYQERAKTIIFAKEPPDKISNSSSWYECKYCEYKGICHDNHTGAVNCRTCRFSEPREDGTWLCGKYSVVIDKERQLTGCTSYEPL